MKKQIIIAVFILIFSVPVMAQFGIAAGGGMIYPGFAESDLYKSKFSAGAGFDVIIRHKLLKISDDITIDARYSYKHYFADVNLPFSSASRFQFSYLTLGITSDVLGFSDFDLYTGAGVSLMTSSAALDYIKDVIETTMLPEFTLGLEWNLSTHYNLFAQTDFQFGEIRVNNDILPLHGFRLFVGGTMFLTE